MLGKRALVASAADVKRQKRSMKSTECFFDLLPVEVLWLLVSFLNSNIDRLHLAKTAKRFLQAVYAVGYETIYVHSVAHLEQIAQARQHGLSLRNTYIDILTCEDVYDSHIELLAGVQSIDLGNCQHLTDRSFEALAGVQSLKVCNCPRLTDNGVRALAGVQSIDFVNCEEITDEALLSLAGVKHIYLFGCDRIADRGVQALRGAETVQILCCALVTDECIKALSSVQH